MASSTASGSKDQDEEKLCKSIMRGFARRNREKHAILAEFGEEDQRASCIDDVSPAKALPQLAVRRYHEQELKCLREFGVYDNADDREAIAHYQDTPVDTM